jgi:hypothetical protein
MKEFEAGKLELPGRPEEEELLRVIARKSMQQARNPQPYTVNKHESPARACSMRDSFFKVQIHSNLNPQHSTDEGHDA